MANDTYQPVPHDAAFREQLLSNPAVKADYDANITTYAILDEILSARREAGLTQAQVAERMGNKSLGGGAPGKRLGLRQTFAVYRHLAQIRRCCRQKTGSAFGVNQIR